MHVAPSSSRRGALLLLLLTSPACQDKTAHTKENQAASLALSRALTGAADAGRETPSSRPAEPDEHSVALARAGAVLLQASDISTRSGLVPGALKRALAGREARPNGTP